VTQEQVAGPPAQRRWPVRPPRMSDADRRALEEPSRASPRLDVALRRIVTGFRGVAAAWLVALTTMAWWGGRISTAAALVVGGLAVLWAFATAWWLPRAARGRPGRGWVLLLADVTVAVGTVLGPVALDRAAAPVAGGYPFSAVVVAAWLRGLPGALGAAGVLAVATALRPTLGPDQPPTDVASTVIFYVIGAGVLAWGMDVLQRAAAARDAAEAELVAAREARAIAEERAATGAHLHDSVLQTLALIQRRSDDPVEVAALARAQERALRDWLAGRREAPAATSFASALEAVAADIEQAHRVTVEVVRVGDAPVEERAAVLLAAVREALLNAARHAGVERVDVYGEVEATGLAVFVRDRGAGFDVSAVPEDRRGVRGSIVERMAAVGGSATIRSAPGRGTEVELRLPSGS
jgi:signal transduction histidine kinase